MSSAAVRQVIALAAELSEEERRVVVDARAPQESVAGLAAMIRHGFRLTLMLGAPLFAIPLGGCSFMHDQVAYTSTNTCMEQECRAEQGAARQKCETACSRRYGK